MGALKNQFNTLSPYNLVSNQSDQYYLIYLQKNDIAQEIVENPNFLSEGLLLTCGCSRESI